LKLQKQLDMKRIDKDPAKVPDWLVVTKSLGNFFFFFLQTSLLKNVIV
jgi:hypothetical protein